MIINVVGPPFPPVVVECPVEIFVDKVDPVTGTTVGNSDIVELISFLPVMVVPDVELIGANVPDESIEEVVNRDIVVPLIGILVEDVANDELIPVFSVIVDAVVVFIENDVADVGSGFSVFQTDVSELLLVFTVEVSNNGSIVEVPRIG